MDSVIEDLNGKPFKKSALTQEIASPSLTGVRQPWMADSVASSLSPQRLGSLLQSANEGSDYDYLTLAGEMEERHCHYGSVLSTRRLAIEALPVQVEAADDSTLAKEIASAVEDLVRQPCFDVLKSDMLDGLGKGRSTSELMWDVSGKYYEIKEFIWRDPRFFLYHPEDPRQLRLIDGEDPVHGLALAPYKFVTHVPRLRTGLPVRAGLARIAAVAYMCASYGLRDWMAFNELFGMPIRIGKYGPTASEPNIAILRRAVANLGSDAAAVIPDSMRIELIERAGGSGSSHKLFESLLEYLDKQISKAVLGQTASTEGTAGKLGNDDAQDEVRQDIKQADAKQLAATINEYVVKPYVDLNWGPQENYPLVEFYIHEAEDITPWIEALDKMVSQGLRVSQVEVRDKLGLSEPEDGAELLGSGVAAAAPVAMNQACTTCNPIAINRSVPAADAVDEMVDELSEWEPVIKPLVDPIQALADESQDEAEFMARLPELLESMDASELVKRLGMAAFQARGLGDSDA